MIEEQYLKEEITREEAAKLHGADELLKVSQPGDVIRRYHTGFGCLSGSAGYVLIRDGVQLTKYCTEHS